MKSKKIAILHFNVIEKYPPVMNFIFDAFEENSEIQILVFTTKNTTSYITPTFPNTKIYRFGTIEKHLIKRYFSYISFNLSSFFILLFNEVSHITVFESLSVFPLWLLSKLKSQMRAHIHFHEYISDFEREKSSLYMKSLFMLENELLLKYTCSHTNEDRKQLFLRDKLFLKEEQVQVRQYRPPNSWWNQYGQFKQQNRDGKIRMVHLGACDNNTMYIKKVLDWVYRNQEILELAFISNQLDFETEKLIFSYSTSSIRVIKPIDYYDLPKELIKYDIGLVLYKGHVPNYIYNIPNKVYEYLSCGLKVICVDCLISVRSLYNPNIKFLNFQNDFDEINIRDLFRS
jgi:hypothetical protein